MYFLNKMIRKDKSSINIINTMDYDILKLDNLIDKDKISWDYQQIQMRYIC